MLKNCYSSELWHLILSCFPKKKINEVNYLQAFLSVNVSMPQVPIMNFRQALKFNPNSSVSAKLDVIDGYNNQAKAVLKVSPFHSYFQFYSCSRAIDQTATGPPSIAKVWVWSQGILGGICDEQSSKKQVLMFYLSIIIPKMLHIYSSINL